MMLLIKIFTVILAWTFVQGDSEPHLYFLQKSEENESEALLAVVFADDEQVPAKCELIKDENQIKEVMELQNDSPVRIVSKDEMENLLDDCPAVSLASDAHPTEVAYDGIPVIFPGTKWCGAGDRAKHHDDLGLHQDTDKCCRAHDLCNDTLAPGETRNKLSNKSPFTALSCQCDEDFYNCLDKVNSVTSNTVGNMYFNVLKRQCYKEEYPLKYPKKCKKYTSILKITCKEWERNTKAPKVYEWIPAKKYKKIPFPGPITVTLPF